MTTFRLRSLRVQLALLGAVAVVVPLLLLLTVVFATTSSEVSMAPGADADETFAIESSSNDGVAAEVVVAAAVLAIAAIAAVWWWSGRAVAPMQAIAGVANRIQGGSLDQRIGLEGAAAEVQGLGDSFDRMLARLQQASATQQALIEDASHELRTPLAALAVNNEIILANPDPTAEDYRSHAERNEALIARLQTTIDDLLMDARSRHQEVRQVDNDLMAIVGRVVDQHRALNPEVPVLVRGPVELFVGIDGPSVQRALVNLMENAARYSPPGLPIEIDVGGDAKPTLSVTDHGPGIAAADMPHVFDRYYRRADDPSDRGSGIGLALVKQVADAHGSIAVTSPVAPSERGTRFTLTFAGG